MAIVSRIFPVNEVVTPPLMRGMPLPAMKRPVRPRVVAQAFRYAAQGLQDAWRSQPNLRVHSYVGLGLIGLGLWCRLSRIEWLWVSLAIGLVIFAELMNTAIELAVDLVVGLRPDPLARRVKDLAASFVLAAASLAVIIGSLTFLPHLLKS